MKGEKLSKLSLTELSVYDITVELSSQNVSVWQQYMSHIISLEPHDYILEVTIILLTLFVFRGNPHL